MKWLFYVVVFVYMFYRAVYGIEIGKKEKALEVLPISYPEGLNYLPSGSRLTVTCKLNNRNQKVEWMDNNNESIKHDATSRLYSHRRIAPSSLKGSQFLMIFTHAVVDDSGIYTCQSEHDKDEVTLCVIDAARFVDTSREEIVDEGRSYTLSCEARGDPQPELIWSKDGEDIDSDDKLNSKYKIFQKFNHDGYESLLTITSVTPEDAGTYLCKAVQQNVLVEGCDLIDAINITLQVNFKPVFQNAGEPTYVFAKYNETVNLDCFANAFPKATYRWFHDEEENQLKEYTAKQIKLLEDDTARLTLHVDSDSFGQKFTCTATNDMGESHQDFILAQLEKPEAPVEVGVAEYYANELVFNFTFNEGNPPFDVIQAQYKISDDSERRPRETEWRRGKLYELEALEDKTDIYYKLPNLDPETKYWIRFRTRNDMGYSGWSQPHSVETRDEEEEPSSDDTTEGETTEEPEASAEEKSGKPNSINDATFYGIFFAGGIFVLSFICMFAMRMV